MSTKDGIDELSGTIDVYRLCPNRGDSIMIVNCGTHYEVRHHHWEMEPFGLTHDDIEDLRNNRIVWN